MRKLLAILVCKAGRWIGKRIGKGSSLPGKAALKICPDILHRVTLPRRIIAVTGSNGKTSTVEMIAAILRSAGLTVIYNEEGSNQTEGVATLILDHADWRGNVKADALLIESDERYAAHTFRWFHPTHFVITNLYRDQLTRNGHPDSVYEAILPALAPETQLILNADDPFSARFAWESPETSAQSEQSAVTENTSRATMETSGTQSGTESLSRKGKFSGNVTWFGLNRCSVSMDVPGGAYHDGAFCPVCGNPMSYDYAHFNHIGAYHCESCGYAKPRTDFTATELDLSAGVLVIDGEVKIHLAFRSIYNVYNILAAYAVCRKCGVSADTAANVIEHYVLKNGRMQTFRLGAHHGTLLTSKHENSIAYDTNLRYIAASDNPCTVLVIVDAVSRKYFTSETSWLWDVDFDLLNVPQVKQIVLSGRYCNDLAERFSYTGLDAQKWHVVEDIPTAAEMLKKNGSEEIYLVTCFSDRDKFLTLTEKISPDTSGNMDTVTENKMDAVTEVRERVKEK